MLGIISVTMLAARITVLVKTETRRNQALLSMRSYVCKMISRPVQIVLMRMEMNMDITKTQQQVDAKGWCVNVKTATPPQSSVQLKMEVAQATAFKFVMSAGLRSGFMRRSGMV
jgi:hypothetical protein